MQQTFGTQYRDGGAETSFYRIGSPICERRTDDESRTNPRRDGSRERDVFSKSEKVVASSPNRRLKNGCIGKLKLKVSFPMFKL